MCNDNSIHDIQQMARGKVDGDAQNYFLEEALENCKGSETEIIKKAVAVQISSSISNRKRASQI